MDKRGQYNEAKPLLLRARSICEQLLGPDHPKTAYSFATLANLYAEQGNYEQAEPLYLRALAIREKVLGPDHPDTVKTRESYTLMKQKAET